MLVMNWVLPYNHRRRSRLFGERFSEDDWIDSTRATAILTVPWMID